MSCRKKHIISAIELNIYKSIVEELSQNPKLEDYDMSTIEISILKNKAAPKIENPDKAIKNLERYIAINKDQDVLKAKLFKIMKVSRPKLKRLPDD